MADDHERFQEFQIKKKIDESWKNAVKKESAEEAAPQAGPVSADTVFSSFISTLSLQAFVALGEFPAPESGEKAVNLPAAQYFIDLIQMLSDKTKGNLSEDEKQMLQDLLYELRMKFVQKTQGS